MTVSLVIGGSQHEHLATTTGWAEFQRWSELLDAEKFPEIVHLAEHGLSQDIPAIRLELHEACKSAKPVKPAVESTLDHLLELLKDAQGESILVTNGITDDDADAEDDFWEGDGYTYDPDDMPDSK